MVDVTDTNLGRKIYTFLNGKYYFDIIYNHYIISKGLQFGYTLSKEMDRGILEMVGPYGLSHSVYNSANQISKLDTGHITTYATYIILSLLALIGITFGSLIMGEMVLDPRMLVILFLFFTFLPNSK